jgi:ATP-dependent Lon protease
VVSKKKSWLLKEPTLKKLFLCKENKRDIEEIKPDYIEGLTFHYVDKMSEVLDIAITNQNVNHPKSLVFKKD